MITIVVHASVCTYVSIHLRVYACDHYMWTPVPDGQYDCIRLYDLSAGQHHAIYSAYTSIRETHVYILIDIYAYKKYTKSQSHKKGIYIIQCMSHERMSSPGSLEYLEYARMFK